MVLYLCHNSYFVSGFWELLGRYEQSWPKLAGRDSATVPVIVIENILFFFVLLLVWIEEIVIIELSRGSISWHEYKIKTGIE